MEHSKGRRQRLIVVSVALLALLGIVIVALAWEQVRQILGQADWRLVSITLLFTAVSYGCLGYGFAVASKLFGIRMSQRDLFEIGFVSFALNHLVAFGGAAGYSLRVLLIKRRRQSIRDVLIASLFHSTFNNLMLLTLFPIGLVYLFLSYPLARGEATSVATAVSLLFLLVLLAAVVIFVKPLRVVVLHGLRHAAYKITRRNIEAQTKELNRTLERGINALKERPLVLVLLMGLVVADWASCVAVLELCFDALGDPLSPGVLLTGFAIGVALGLLSMVPGGLGVQEASMATVYTLLGVPLEQATLAAILFRVIYYFIPFLVSLGFYWRLLRGNKVTPELYLSSSGADS